jgi:WhiB family redox-sensing transcriptional regulator
MPIRPLNVDDYSFHDDGACRHHGDPDIWHADCTSNKPWDVAARIEAKRICKDECPVRGQCLEYAMRTRQPTGIWGGLGPRDRTVLRNKIARRA